MTDRADYLARILIARLASLQKVCAEDHGREPDRRQRIEVIEKVLAVELGVTDGPTLALIEAALPNLAPAQRGSDREVAAFAEFLRRRLRAELAESN